MIRFFLSQGFSKSLPIMIEQVAVSQKVVPIRLFSESKAGKESKGRFSFSEEEAKRGPAVGSVQSHLPWVSEEQEVNAVQKEQRTEKSIELSIQNDRKEESYLLAMKAINVLTHNAVIKEDERIALQKISNRVSREYTKVHSVSANH